MPHQRSAALALTLFGLASCTGDMPPDAGLGMDAGATQARDGGRGDGDDAGRDDATVDGRDAGDDAVRDPRLPAGRPHFVVAHGVLTDDARDNVVRIGTYEFDPEAGRVEARMWLWSQRTPTDRVSTGTAPRGDCAGTATTVHTCEVLTADGFLGPPNDVRTGTYELDTGDRGPYVVIEWGEVSPFWETWYLHESLDGSYVSLELSGSRGITHGFGYGSDAALDTRRPMETVAATTAPLRFDFVQWVRDEVTSRSDLTWTMGHYDACSGADATTWVMTYYQPSSPRSCRSGCVEPYSSDTSIQYYIQQISSYDRRDTFWHWCTCLAQAATCYPPDGNSHVKPMLQILDDGGNFRGWVGVEASFYRRRHSSPRANDMFQVFRVRE